MTGTVVAVVIYCLFGLIYLGIATIPFAPVARARVEKFARRQALPITLDNGPVVIDYLATTRRWRGTGLVVVLTASFLHAAMQGGQLRFTFFSVFAGWFVGAVIAEWRVSSRRRDGGRRVASLVPRRATDYLPIPILVIVAVAFVAVVASDVDAVVRAAATRDRLELFGWILATIAAVVVISRVAWQVLTRPQVLASADVMAADDAVRSRSLHVLAGSALAIAGYLLTGAGDVAGRSGGWLGVGWAGVATAVGALVVPLLGAFVATWPYSARRRRPVRALGAAA